MQRGHAQGFTKHPNHSGICGIDTAGARAQNRIIEKPRGPWWLFDTKLQISGTNRQRGVSTFI
jgi:hypothetical protein